MERGELPAGWQWTPLQDVCLVNPRRPVLDYDANEPTTFVPMAAADNVTGTIIAPEEKRFGEVSRGYTYFEEGDVLFSKITPCMQNGKHAVALDLRQGFGFGTTEFHVLRPSDRLDPHWLHAFLRQPAILHHAEQSFTGSVGQQRVPASFLETLEIPLPPLPEQQRIAQLLKTKLAAVERARQASAARLAAARELSVAYLREVFESEGVQKWSAIPLGEVMDLRRDVVHPRNKPTGDSVFVGLEHIESGTGKRIGSENVKKENLTGRKPQFYVGDIGPRSSFRPEPISRWSAQRTLP